MKVLALTSALRLLAVLLALGAGVWFVLRADTAQDVLISGATARPLGEGRAVGYLTVEARGGPDRLLAVTSPVAEAALYSPADPAGVPLPEGTASLALDAAHISLNALETLEDGSLIPVTLTFEHAGEVTAKLKLSDPAKEGAASEHGLFGVGDICVVGEGEPAPQISLSVTPDAEGYLVTVMAEDFTFSEAMAGLYHVPGMGHGHLYVGGAKIGRLYENTAHIGRLPPGRHELRVTLNTNDHRAYVVEEVPVTASAVIEVDAAGF